MKVQRPAEGILIVNDWGDSKVYEVVCGCGQPDHTHHLWVESDDAGVNVNIHVTVKSPFWSISRWRQIWNLLTKGYLEHETTICMSEQQALNYAKALTSAMKDVKIFRDKRIIKVEK
jgi:hypothetical protein